MFQTELTVQRTYTFAAGTFFDMFNKICFKVGITIDSRKSKLNSPDTF
jgi:hypothetical protein